MSNEYPQCIDYNFQVAVSWLLKLGETPIWPNTLEKRDHEFETLGLPLAKDPTR